MSRKIDSRSVGSASLEGSWAIENLSAPSRRESKPSAATAYATDITAVHPRKASIANQGECGGNSLATRLNRLRAFETSLLSGHQNEASRSRPSGACAAGFL